MSKERPIFFSAPMARAILAGRKSQTRRIIKKPEWYGCPTGDCHHGAQQECDEAMNSEEVLTDCPYGVPGDRMWVRESYGLSIDVRGKVVVRYKADDSARFALAEDNGECDLCGLAGVADPKRCEPVERWKPSIHMPRVASRLTLLIKSVRVERLQEISEGDAIAEGCEPTHYTEDDVRQVVSDRRIDPNVRELAKILGAGTATAKYAYCNIWDQINGPGSWAANPWVWVVGFERIA